MLGIVDRRQQVSVYVIDRFAFEYFLRETFGNFVTVANSIFPMLKRGGGFIWRFRSCDQGAGELRILISREAKNNFCKVFLGSRVTGAANHLPRIDLVDWLQGEMSVTNKNGSGYEFVDRA